MRTTILILLLGANLIGLAGCASVENTSGYITIEQAERWADKRAVEIRKELSEKRFRDAYNGKQIISEGYDLYIIEGGNKRRVTNTPDIKETGAFFTKDGTFIIYVTTDENFMTAKYSIQPSDKDDNYKEEISEPQYSIYHQERFPEVYKY